MFAGPSFQCGQTDIVGAERRAVKLSPRRRAALKVQGRYIGLTRTLDPKQKARVKALRAEKGFPAAIALAKKLKR